MRELRERGKKREKNCSHWSATTMALSQKNPIDNDIANQEKIIAPIQRKREKERYIYVVFLFFSLFISGNCCLFYINLSAEILFALQMNRAILFFSRLYEDKRTNIKHQEKKATVEHSNERILFSSLFWLHFVRCFFSWAIRL